MLALSTDSLKGYGTSRIFKFAKEAGYDGIDLYIDPKNFDTSDPEYLKELVNQFNLPILSIQSPDKANAEIIENTVTLAKEVGCKIIIIQSPKFFNFKFVQWLKNEIPKIRKKEEISIALENSPQGTLLGFIPEYAMNNLNELKQFKHCCLDTSRLAQKKWDLMRSYHRLKQFIVHIHLSNVYKSKFYYLPNDGVLPLESFLTKLKQEGYKGAISMKVLPKFIKVGDDPKVLENLKKMKKFYEDYFVGK